MLSSVSEAHLKVCYETIRVRVYFIWGWHYFLPLTKLTSNKKVQEPLLGQSSLNSRSPYHALLRTLTHSSTITFGSLIHFMSFNYCVLNVFCTTVESIMIDTWWFCQAEYVSHLALDLHSR